MFERRLVTPTAPGTCWAGMTGRDARAGTLLNEHISNSPITAGPARRLYLGKSPIELQLPGPSLTQSFRILACGAMSHGDEISREKDILKINFDTATGFAFTLQVPFPRYFSWCLL